MLVTFPPSLPLYECKQMNILKKFIDDLHHKRKVTVLQKNVEIFVTSNGGHLFVLKIIEGATAPPCP